MKVTKSKTFVRKMTEQNYHTECASLDAEVNTFVATIPLSDLLDVRQHITHVSPFASQIMASVHVLYLEENT
jgi:hypothetical protein